jgi:hypothetical protein
MPGKRAHCDSFFQELNILPCYIDPVRTSAIAQGDLVSKGIVSAAWTRRTPLPGACQSFEIACALSHRKACQCIVDADVPWGFVFEDDNVVMGTKCIPRFKNLVRWAESNHTEFTVINASPCNSLHTFGKGLLPGTQGCTNVLLYSRKGAEHVVNHLLPIRSPIDDWLHMNMPNAFCIHDRIFAQQDTSAPLSLLTALNPILCKYEYLVNPHSVLVVALLGFVLVCTPFMI